MSEQTPPAPTDHRGDAYSVIANAAKLAGSLVVSFGISIAVRQFLIPRTLGTERFGELNFADGFAQLFMTVSWLGIDTWLRKELGVSLKSADGLFGGVLFVRSLFTVVTIGTMGLVLWATGRPFDIVILAAIFALANLMVQMQNTASALLHAAGRVDGLSVVNIVGKLLWAGGVIPVLYFQLPLIWLAVAYAGSEAFKAVGSTVLARLHTPLTMRVDLKATFKAMKSSLAFWANAIALAGMGRADVAVLGTMSVGLLGSQAAANREVGWYTVVLGLSGMLMAVTPVVGWVLVPLLARAQQRGTDDAAQIIRRAVEVTVLVGVPVSLGMFVAADEIIALYKPEYGPAGLVLKILAGTFMLTYLNVVTASCLIAVGRGWTVTMTSFATLFMTPLLDFLLVPYALHRWGPGAGAAVCALSLVVAETFTTSLMLRNLGRLAVDARLRSVVLRTLVTIVGVVALDWVLKGQAFFPWGRVALDAVAYVVLALGTRSVRISEAKELVRMVRARRAAA